MSGAKRFANVVITGASSGIGAALAARLARPDIRIGLVGRNPDKLKRAAKLCESKGATVEQAELDVTNRSALRAFVSYFEASGPIDLLIANAGILDGRHFGQTVEEVEVARRVLDTNLMATVDLLHAVLPGMRRRGSGAITIVASLASMIPLADAPAYSASKAALLSYGLALRDAVAEEGVDVTVACPGFVNTAMARVHIGARPGEITADDAAARILAGVKKNQGVIAFPFLPSLFSRFALFAPEWVRRRSRRNTAFHVEY